MKNRLAKVGAMIMTVAVLATSTVPVLASEEIPAFSDGTNDSTVLHVINILALQ